MNTKHACHTEQATQLTLCFTTSTLWLGTCTHTRHYIWVDLSSYNAHLSRMAAPRYVCIDVSSDNPSGLLHTSQQNGCSPLCMRWCLFSFVCLANVLLHTLQEYWHSSWRPVRVPCKITWGKNMRIPVGRYVSVKSWSSEMFSWYGERGTWVGSG
jgi:hypothetical protein